MGSLDGKVEKLASARRQLRALEQVRQCRRVQYPRRRLAHIAHEKPDSASALVVTLLAAPVCRLTCARQRSERSFDRAQHLSGGDQRRRLRKKIPATASLSAVQEAVVLQLQENEFQEAARNVFALCNIRDQNRTFAVLVGEHDERLERVLRFLGNHLAFGAPGSMSPIIRYSNLADNISPMMPIFSS